MFRPGYKHYSEAKVQRFRVEVAVSLNKKGGSKWIELEVFLIVIFIETSEENVHIDIQGLNGFWEKVATKMRALTIALIL